ncbi:NAD(P)-dependent oxidoreductase [Rhodococcus sp. NPDC058532]|uniref:NAD(P)-dependent oxidoreductase n=1 Tax=Rhodococcus sp. NPDC058532 TaxID=3346540 RepID=UPI00364BE740
MNEIVVFGGGRAGRRVVAEAASRGRAVTVVARDPHRYTGPVGNLVRVVAGDVTDRGDVARIAAGHSAAIHTAARMDVPSTEFYVAAARALTGGLVDAGVPRLVAVGIGTMLETQPGVRVLDAPGFPAEAREFSLGHVAELDVLESADAALDWVMLAPPPVVLDEDAPRTGRYRTGGTCVLGDGAFSYADLAVALVDEAENARHSRALVAVG